MHVTYKILGIAILTFILTILTLQWPPASKSEAAGVEYTSSMDTIPSQKLIVNLDRLNQSLNVTDSLATVIQKKSL